MIKLDVRECESDLGFDISCIPYVSQLPHTVHVNETLNYKQDALESIDFNDLYSIASFNNTKIFKINFYY